jgi:hypothetical protein
MYSYTELRPDLFTERGVEALTAVRRNVGKALALAGAVRAQEAWRGVTGDSWLMLACLDYMVEKHEIREVSPEGSPGQHRLFVSVN